MPRRALLSSLVAALLCIPAAPAQDAVPVQPSAEAASQLRLGRQHSGDPLRDEQLRKMEKQRSLDRHKQIKKDTDQLLQLATQLKEYVDKTNENVLSVDVIRKAEEIEKLAKKVRSNMRDSVQAPSIP